MKTLGRQLRHNLPASHFKEIEDPRRAQGRVHRLVDVLTTLLLGLVIAEPTLRDVEASICGVARKIGLRSCPSDSTLTRVLHALKPAALLPCVGEQVRAMHRSKQLIVDEALGISLVAIDGKALLTGKTPFNPEAQPQGAKGIGPPYVLRVLRAMHTSSAVKPILGQRTIPAVTSESATLWPFIEDLLKEYRRTGLLECVTVDAGFTYAADMRRVHEEGIGFIAALKGNQPGLLEGAQLFLGSGEQDPPHGWEHVAETIDTGRRVTRWFARTTELDRWHPDWPFLRGVWRIRQRTVHAGTVTWEDRYFLTNLPWNRLDAGQAIRAVIAHWAIENQANWTMDVCWREDSGAWVKSGAALETLAILRILAFNFTRLVRHRGSAARPKTRCPIADSSTSRGWRCSCRWSRPLTERPRSNPSRDRARPEPRLAGLRSSLTALL